jgi:uncharacterized membrane protein (DUF485 family)
MITEDALAKLHQMRRTRLRLVFTLTAAMLFVYLGFITLIAFDKPLLGTILVPGLSLGILLGAAVILLAWLSTFIYVQWMNKHHDPLLEAQTQEIPTQSQEIAAETLEVPNLAQETPDMAQETPNEIHSR